MAINFGTANILTLAEAARLVPGRPHVATIFRWCRYGCRGVRLDYSRMGRRMLTTREALERFGNALAALDEQEDAARAANRACQAVAPIVKSRTKSQRQRAIEKAEAECTAAGL